MRGTEAVGSMDEILGFGDEMLGNHHATRRVVSCLCRSSAKESRLGRSNLRAVLPSAAWMKSAQEK